MRGVETDAGRAAEEGEAASPAYVQEFTRFQQRSDAIPAKKLHHFPRYVYPAGEIRKTARFLQTRLFGKRNPAQIQQFDMDDFTRKGILQNCRNFTRFASA
ncbi:hypothetical protein [Paenibacillus thiaminolyticus]|uniref:hypothetical protein n=1 Tax=Paenibacillus thiaminolyticus TaxID=49283 RepID=UPI002282054F|nr:hypothetical protein [Paenibacillus thiaminolyticus]MCY9646316.1 hypothetical protein [Paenibacillus thiaminolyticus]